MKNILVYIVCVSAILSSAMFFYSCAMIIPPQHPNLSEKDYKLLPNEKAVCYDRQFRAGMLLLDLLMWPALIIDAAGGYYYYYSPKYCANNEKDNLLQNETQNNKSKEQKNLHSNSETYSTQHLELNGDYILSDYKSEEEW
ncbi:MAG: hypothetical protein HUK20_07005 [Fibrobacter sp.]|nr:hypothetical protein [Fibrobacter sp.]